jgi:glycosyltransferase involved in cell wall biosynthesis
MANKRTILFLTQVFPPDPAAVGQHMADAAREVASRGYRVVVLTARRGYEDPSARYPARDVLGGVEIIRVPLASFGKGSIARRILGAAGFLAQALWRGLWIGDLRGIVFTTSPPLAGLAALGLGWVRRAPLVFWVMDVNPDQFMAVHPHQARSFKVRALAALNRRALKASAVVVALDPFMAERLRARAPAMRRLEIMPPWPHEEHLAPVPRAENPFRAAHGLGGRLVVMYSGNHSPVNPLDTLLQAAERFADDPRIAFLFVGGGAGKAAVEELIRTRRPSNILSLPYQPLEGLGQSLSAADVHVVTLGDSFVGIVHPCKVYGAMSVARPILYFGPRPSHVSEIVERERIGWCLAHGDVEGTTARLEAILHMDAGEREAMGQRAREAIQEGLSKEILCRRFADVVQEACGGDKESMVDRR